MSKTYDYGVFIGRFNPFHLGHLNVIASAFRHCSRVIVIIGSANEPRSFRNPFTDSEREDMIRAAFKSETHKIDIGFVEDTKYNDELWVQSVTKTVSNIIDNRIKSGFDHIDITGVKVTLVGHQKDETSYYLKKFPRWFSMGVPNYKNINGTDIRNQFFNEGVIPHKSIPVDILPFLERFMKTDEFRGIKEEYDYIKKYKSQFMDLPYEPVFVTVDACVIQSGHVLLVRRRAQPGKGLYALPGGFLNPHEKIEDAIFRELKEETKIKVPEAVLRGSMNCVQVFDYPHRSARGRTITHAALIHLKEDTKLPKVVGSDDADKAIWVPLGEIKRENLFEDHKDIIDTLVANSR